MVKRARVLLKLLVVFALPAFAQDYEDSEPGAIRLYELESGQRPPGAQEFGILDASSLLIPYMAFMQRSGSGREYAGAGYIYRSSGSIWFEAPVNLPAGAEIQRIRLYLYDNSPTENIRIWYSRHRTDTGALEDLAWVESSGTPGFTTVGFDPFPHRIFDKYHLYKVVVRLPTSDDSLRFKGVRILYKRQISAAPATATFSDVPVTHPFFKEIEALAASGITTGYPGGIFRPNDPVTRMSMAVFLARPWGSIIKTSGTSILPQIINKGGEISSPFLIVFRVVYLFWIIVNIGNILLKIESPASSLCPSARAALKEVTSSTLFIGYVPLATAMLGSLVSSKIVEPSKVLFFKNINMPNKV